MDAAKPVQAKILLLHGPNLNRLGRRNADHYGTLTLLELEALVKWHAETYGFDLLAYQSNHEGDLIDFIQDQCEHAQAILINPGALSHYSYALHDALLDAGLPVVEVHLSAISEREIWRRQSVIAPIAVQSFSGQKEKSYLDALRFLFNHIHHDSP